MHTNYRALRPDAVFRPRRKHWLHSFIRFQSLYGYDYNENRLKMAYLYYLMTIYYVL